MVMAAAVRSTETMLQDIAPHADSLPTRAGHTLTPPASPDHLIAVQTMWNGWRTALVRVGDLENLHWFQPVGAPRALLHAELLCTALRSGSVPHQCDPATRPHRLMVCVIKSHVTAVIFEALANLAGERPR